MKPDMAEIVAALPGEFTADSAEPDALATLLETVSQTPPPTGRISRMWAIGSLEGMLALGYIMYWVRAAFDDTETRQRRLDQVHLDGALRVLARMSYLRGAVMKIGQVLGAYPHILPRQYMDVLSSLHFQAPPMHFSLLREMVRGDLGAEPEDLFESFSTEPFAAASLGQVHRATTIDGHDVAVKIQYPGIARTIRSDLRNLSAFLLPMRLGGDWPNLREQIEVVRTMLEQETDYESEAEHLRIARSAFREEDDIVLPSCHQDVSRKRVITTDFLPGVHLDEYLASRPTQEQRNRRAEQISTAIMRLYFGPRYVFADLHPGNILFMPDGRLGLIDFGCCHVFTPSEIEYLDLMERHVRAEPVDWRQAILDGTPLSERQRQDEKRLEFSCEMLKWFWQPLINDEVFDFSDAEFMERGFELMTEFARRRYLRQEPVNAWFPRFFTGFRVLLHRLGAQINVFEIYRRESAHLTF